MRLRYCILNLGVQRLTTRGFVMVVVMPLRGIRKSIPVTWEWKYLIFGIVGEPTGGCV